MEIKVDIDELIKLVSTAADAYTTAFFWADNQNRRLTLWRSYSLGDSVIDGVVIPFSDDCIGWVAQNRKPLVLNFSERDNSTLAFYSRDEEIKSLLAVPVMRGNVLEGVLCVDSKRTYVFAPRIQKLLTLFAAQFAHLVNNMRIKKFVYTDASDVALLNNCCEQIALAEDQATILQIAFDSLSEMVENDSCMLGLRVNNNPDVFRVELARGYRNLKKTVFSCNDGLARAVIRNKRPVIVDTVAEESISSILGFLRAGDRFKSFLGVPLSIRGEVIGLLCFMHRVERAFAGRDTRVATIVANYATLALANLKCREKAAHLLNDIDGLTGLHNFTGFRQHLEESYHDALDKRRHLSMIIIDIDDFKRINTVLGYRTGNEI